MSTATPQQINVADLELPQLAEVKRQLEEVCTTSLLELSVIRKPDPTLLGAFASDQLFRPTQASAGKVPLVHREHKGGQARQQRHDFLLFTYMCT